ncbi:MAG: hypothetical protein ACI9XZ_003253 [Alphaproteobacteria bacterium]|jgi:hypothetical protein
MSIPTVRASRKTIVQATVAILMTGLVTVLLVWQDARYQLVSQCHANGGQWDGAAGRCRPVPKIYIERGLKRT